MNRKNQYLIHILTVILSTLLFLAYASIVSASPVAPDDVEVYGERCLINLQDEDIEIYEKAIEALIRLDDNLIKQGVFITLRPCVEWMDEALTWEETALHVRPHVEDGSIIYVPFSSNFPDKTPKEMCLLMAPVVSRVLVEYDLFVGDVQSAERQCTLDNGPGSSESEVITPTVPYYGQVHVNSFSEWCINQIEDANNMYNEVILASEGMAAYFNTLGFIQDITIEPCVWDYGTTNETQERETDYEYLRLIENNGDLFIRFATDNYYEPAGWEVCYLWVESILQELIGAGIYNQEPPPVSELCSLVESEPQTHTIFLPIVTNQ